MSNSAFENWYPIAFSYDIKPNKIYSLSLLNEPLIVYRDKENKISCLQDRCPHRSTPLSLGRLNNGAIECMYHGWQFNRNGDCIEIPAIRKNDSLPPNACVPNKMIIERHNIVWIYNGEDPLSNIHKAFDDIFAYADESTVRFDYSIDLDIPHELMIENLLDPSHLPFAHHRTLSNRNKAGPIEFEVTQTGNSIDGIATVYSSKANKTINFHFMGPHTVYFDIEFNNKGMRQIHYCIPLTPRKMRLISVFYYKNMPWLKWIPFIKLIQKKMSKKIVYQDIAMLTGQDDNIRLGAKPWNQAINADKLAYIYRQWLDNEFKKKSPWFEGFIPCSVKKT